MTEWIKENKFAAVLLGISILVMVGTYLFSGSKSTAYDESKYGFDTTSNTFRQLIGMKPFPNADNLEDRRKEVTAYRGQVEGLQKALLTTYRPEKFGEVDASAFVNRVKEEGDALKVVYGGKRIAFPEKWQLGFETYTSGSPKPEATGYLNYELDGLKWLYTTLAEAGPTALLNVYRPRLPIEDGNPMVEPAKRGQRNKKAPKPYHALPVELTFRGPEASLRKFLDSLAGSKKYFYVIRSVRIQNDKPGTPPKSTDANFEALPAVGEDPDVGEGEFEIPGEDTGVGEDPADDVSGDIDLTPTAPEEEEAVPTGEQILAQVLGAEEVNVFLQLELILFRDDIELPVSK